MTENENRTTDHRAPLKPGEIRTHTVGDRTFQVMHVAGGSFAQASYRDGDRLSVVIATDTNIDAVVRAYADAIEAAESVEQPTSGWTSHGHAMRGVPQVGERPDSVARCGGPAVCQECGREEAAATASQTAPNFADDVAGLRLGIKSLYSEHRHTAYAMLAILDRIAAQVPVRATAPDGRLAWQHNCGQVAYGLGLPPFCPTCVVGPTPDCGTWSPLYTLGGAA